MPVLDTYGSRTRTAGRLAGQVAARLRVQFVAHESPSRGTFYRAEAPPHRIEVQPNTVDEQVYSPKHPHMRALVLVLSPGLDSTLGATMDTVADLVHLSRDTTIDP